MSIKKTSDETLSKMAARHAELVRAWESLAEGGEFHAEPAAHFVTVERPGGAEPLLVMRLAAHDADGKRVALAWAFDPQGALEFLEVFCAAMNETAATSKAVPW